jgi:hypothetical protein
VPLVVWGRPAASAFRPPRARSLDRDLAATRRAERRRTSGPALLSAQPAEFDRVRIGRRAPQPRKDRDALGRRVTLRAWRADLERIRRFFLDRFGLADEALATDAENRRPA